MANLLTLAVTLSMAATPLLLLIDDAIARAREAGASRIRDAAGRRRPRHHRRLRPLRPDRRARAARPADPLHRARSRTSSRSISCEALRRADLSTATPGGSTSCARPAPTRHAPSCSPSTMSRLAAGRRDGAHAFSRPADLCARARPHATCTRLMDLGRRDHRARDVPRRARADQGSAARPGAEGARGAASRRETFKRLDEKRLYEDYQYYTDLEKVRANAHVAGEGARGAVRARRRGTARRRRREAHRVRAR